MALERIGRVRRVAVVAKEGLRKAESLSKRLIDELCDNGFSVFACSPLKHERVLSTIALEQVSKEKMDLVFAVGGDGTLLRTLRVLDDETPVMSIHAGGRGILSAVKPEEISKAVKALQEGAIYVERRLRLSPSLKDRRMPPATNEVYLIRSSVTQTPTFSLSLSGSTIFEQRMDGLMVSTPTGSTGHSFSLAGPVLCEDLDAMLITPVCPLNRLPPLVLPLEPLSISTSHRAIMVIDGQETYELEEKAELVITRHVHDAMLAKLAPKRLGQLIGLGLA